MDGTLYSGTRLFAQTLPFLEGLRNLGIGHTFLTNNTSRSKSDYLVKLRNLGIEANESEIYTPAESTIAYLRNSLPHAKAAPLVGTPSLVQESGALACGRLLRRYAILDAVEQMKGKGI
jgi:NagD protein